MTKSLLIITVIMILLLVICPIIVGLIMLKETKEKDVLKKLITCVAIFNGVIFIVLLSLWISPIKNNELTISSNNTKEETNKSTEESSGDELSNAGFNALTVDQYIELINSSEKSIILIARPTCGYCQMFTPILKQAKEEMNLTINYVNTDDFSKDDWSKFENSLDYIKSEDWGTPLTLIVQDGKVLADNNGYVELDSIKEFFKENGFGE